MIDYDAMEAQFNQDLAEAAERDVNRAETKTKLGDNFMRMFPLPDDVTSVYVECKIHYNVGPKRNRRMFCLTSWSDPCPVCDRVKQLYDSQDEEDQAYAKRLRANKKFIFLVLNRAEEDRGPQILLAAPTIRNGIMADYLRKPDRIILHDPVNGFDVNIKRTVEKRGGKDFTSYNVIRDPDRTPITDPEQLKLWVSDAPHPVEWFNSQRITYENAVAILQGRQTTPGIVPTARPAVTNTQTAPTPAAEPVVIEQPPLPDTAPPGIPTAQEMDDAAEELQKRLKANLAGAVA